MRNHLRDVSGSGMKENQPLVLQGWIGPHERRLVTARPQLIFRGRRLVYAGPSATFLLCAVMVGRSPQEVGSIAPRGCPIEVYAPWPKALVEAIEKHQSAREIAEMFENCKIDTAQVAMDVGLLVENLTNNGFDFSATIFGDTLP